MELFDRFIIFLRHHWRALFITAGVIALLVFSATAIYRALKNATLNILVAPAGATVTINGATYQNGSYSFFPQSGISAYISKDGYQAQDIQLDLNPNETAQLRVALVDDAGGYASYLNNLDDYTLLDILAPTLQNPDIDQLLTKVASARKIYSILPVNTTTSEFYRDQHGFIVTAGSGTIIQIMLDSSTEGRCAVIPCLIAYDSNEDINNIQTYLTEQGFDPSLYQIELSPKTLYTPVYNANP